MLKLSKNEAKSVAAQLSYKRNGLVPVVAQDKESKDILMVAFANQEAIEKSLLTGRMHYWSTERNKLWLKGETSGNYQALHGFKIDCDEDTVLVTVTQKGGACHKGYWSCFFREIRNGKVTEAKVKKWKTSDAE